MFKDMAQFVTGNDTLLLAGKMRIDCYVSDTIYNRSEATPNHPHRVIWQARALCWAAHRSIQKGHGYHIFESVFEYRQRFEVVSFFHQLSGRKLGAVIFGILPVFLRRELFTCHLLGIHKDPLHFNGKRLLIFLRKRTAGE